MPKSQWKMRKALLIDWKCTMGIAEHRCKVGADDVIMSAYPISLEITKALALEMHKPHKLQWQ